MSNHPFPSDTIAAISSAPGEGAISVVRVSGPAAVEIAERICSLPVAEMASHAARVGWVRQSGGQVVDQVVCLVFRAPRSFTGEDVVEFQTHGGMLVPRLVLQLLIEAGARAALPGEFSARAVLNGKMDLAQAESVQALIGARNELALRAAQQTLRGELSQFLQRTLVRLFDLAGILEAWVDFPEEDLEFASFEEVAASLAEVMGSLQDLRNSYRQGQRFIHGVAVCLVGIPNAGKSSLMNRLLGQDRAIVTPIAGTTRDLLESEWRLGGVHVRLIDTAGIRETEELIEVEGIRRSRAAFEQADIVLAVLDASRPHDLSQAALREELPAERTVWVWNKADLLEGKNAPLPSMSRTIDAVRISASTGQGMESLLQTLQERVWAGAPPSAEALVLTQERHVQAIDAALQSFALVAQGLRNGLSAEYVSLEMRSGLQALSSITGQSVTESILSAVFSRFCLGK